MKVAIKITVDIDPEAWERDYGVPRPGVNEDVKVYVNGLVTEHLRSLDLLAKS